MNLLKYFPLLLVILAQLAHGQVRYFCTDWGRNVPWDVYCQRVAEAGYDGIETWVPADDQALQQLLDACRKHKLSYIFLCSGSGTDSLTYATSYRQALERAVAHQPVLVNCHTGKDHFSTARNDALIRIADSISRKSGIPIVHETHRGRFSFAAHVTQRYLRRLPALRLTLDISHWCNVHESMLGDQTEAVALALERTGHIHARVGHPQGPQVNDPAAPEWKAILDQHLAWWDTVVSLHRDSRRPLTITMEFGPAGYLPTLPYTRQPVADQWELNRYMLNLLKTRYGS